MIKTLGRRVCEVLAGNRGAALAEYAMLLAVVALVLVGTMGKLGNELGKRVDKTVKEIQKVK